MLAEILEPIIDNLARKQRPIGQQEHDIHRAGAGAGIIVTCLWWVTVFALVPDVQRGAEQLFRAIGLPSSDSIPLLVWALVLVTGGLLFFTGAARSRGERDIMVAAKAIIWIAGAAALLWVHAFVANSPFVDFVLMTIYVWTIASGTTRLFLALRGMPTSRLPDPEEMGLPVSGPASRDEAAEGMSGERNGKPPRFRD